VPIDGTADPLVLKKRVACPVSAKGLGKPHGQKKVSKEKYLKDENEYENKKAEAGVPSGGYLIGRHPECDRRINIATVSNRHCLIFAENKDGHALAVVEDLSGNGTYVNEAFIGRNKRRELQDGDELSILDKARFIFRYPRNRDGSAFHKQYMIQGQLGKGHFATVYLATERSSGMRFAVKKFEKRTGPGERSKIDGLQQEIAVLMGVSHPNMLCLKDTFDEADGVYLVLELAPEGELFNWVVMKQKLTESETRKVFVQLFQGIKYLVSLMSTTHSCQINANIFIARAQHRPPRHQARKHPGHRQRAQRQDCRLWSRKDHWRGIVHHHTMWYTFIRCPRNPGAVKSSTLHSCRRHLESWSRALHLPLWLPSFL
jgi:serine/threonine-protein kinase Chk2